MEKDIKKSPSTTPDFYKMLHALNSTGTCLYIRTDKISILNNAGELIASVFVCNSVFIFYVNQSSPSLELVTMLIFNIVLADFVCFEIQLV